MSRSAGVHLFICSRGQTLPRWRDAFGRQARAAALTPQGLSKEIPQAAVVWFRLEPGVPVAEQLARLPAGLSQLPLVVMSDLPGDEEALLALGNGAKGYCNTHAAPGVLQQIAAVILQGGLWIGESLMRRLLRATAVLPPVAAEPSAPRSGGSLEWAARLTKRERAVAEAVAGGASNKEVARALRITERTVKAHVGAVLEKLGVRDRLQLALVINGRLSAGVPVSSA